MRKAVKTLSLSLLLGLGAAGISEAQITAGRSLIRPTGETNVYPWRAESRTEDARSPAPPAVRQASAPLGLLGRRLRNQNQQEPTQEPESAAKNFTDQVPQAPTNPTPSPNEQRPALQVQSNATDPDLGNQQKPSSWCNLGPVQRLIGTTPRGTNIGGFTQMGYHNGDLPYLNNRDDRFNLHQVWTYIDHPAARQPGLNLGFRIDALYGIDGQEFQAIGNSPTGAPSGWDNGWDFGSYGAALPQAYVEIANCDVRVQAGRFLSPFGFEQVPSVENFFYSRTYSRFYTQPFGHTGVLAFVDAGPGLTVLSGLTAGWNTGFENTDNGFNYLGGIRYQMSPNVNLAFTNSVGDTGHRGSGILQSAVAQVQLNDRLSYVFQGDFLNLQSNDEFGITNYMFYCINPCLSLGSRVEWWKSDQLFNSTRSTWSFTSGLNYRPHANFVIRPELRMDYGAAAIDSGRLIPAIDAIILF
jgi:hypothetical protein